MDRFIADVKEVIEKLDENLKSNMDRFIECRQLIPAPSRCYLKSNMDRFIVLQSVTVKVCTAI